MNTPTTDRSIWRREVMAWCCYDWANSGYTTLMITIFVVYIQRTVFSPESVGCNRLRGLGLECGDLHVDGALLSPVVGRLPTLTAANDWGWR